MARWGLSGGLAALRGRAFFIFQFAPGAKGLGFASGSLLQRKAVRIGGGPRGDFACCGKRPRALPWTRSRGAPLENPNPWQHQEPVSDAVGVQIRADKYPGD